MRKQEIFIILAILFVLLLSLFFLIFKQKKQQNTILPKEELTSLPLLKKVDLPLEVIEEFDREVLALKEPSLLLDFLNENFTLLEGEREIALEPEVFFHLKKGTEEDFAVFALYVLDFHNYESGILRYRVEGKEELHTLVVFREKDEPKYFYFENNKVKVASAENSFEDLMRVEEKRIGKKILKYGAILRGNLKMTPKNWVERYKML